MTRWKEATDADFKSPGEKRLWATRSTLMRIKRPRMVVSPCPYNAEPAHAELLDEHHPPEKPFDCNEDDCECFSQFFPASHSIDDDTAHHIISSLVTDAQQDLAFLRETLADHADFLVTRWKKKSREKRAIFLSKNVDLYDKKFAAVHLLHLLSGYEKYPYPPEFLHDLDALGDRRVKQHLCKLLYDTKVSEMRSQYQDTWLLPYLDSDILSEDPSLLLSLLYHRTAHDLERWVLFDNSHVVLAEQMAVVPHCFNAHCVVLKGPDFGKLVDWNCEQAHRYEIAGFTKARYILMAQQTIMAFLRKCVTGLLDEANSPPILSLHPKWSHMIHTNFSRFETSFAWSTDSVKPFSEPPAFDPVETVELIASRHRVIRDHIELQIDPAYVQYQIREMNAALFFENFQHKDKWPFFVDQLFVGPLTREFYWRQLKLEGDRMMQAFQEFKDSPSEKTKAAYHLSIMVMLDCCIETFAVFQRYIDYSLFYQRGFELNFNFTGSGRVHRNNRQYATRDCFPEDILFWSIDCLGWDQYRPFTMDPWLNFSAIDYLCRTDPKEAERIGQTLLDQLSDMAVLNEIICNIRCESSLDRRLTEVRKNGVHEEFREQFLKKCNVPKDSEIGDRMASKLHDFCTKHPWPKGIKNEKWLEQAIESRKSLELFWQGTRIIWSKKMRNAGVAYSYIENDLAQMQATKTEKYLSELAAEKAQVHQHEMFRRMQQKDEPIPEVQTVWGKEVTPQSIPIRPKKLRQEPEISERASHLPATELNMQYEPPSMPAVIPVKRDNMAIFKHMFPCSGEESQRCFSWQYFLNAMTDAGFSILQSQGSAVTLKLDEEKGEKVNTIVVHRPHPVSTINPVMLRSIAKRMAKWFGWKRELFVEREKADEGRPLLR